MSYPRCQGRTAAKQQCSNSACYRYQYDGTNDAVWLCAIHHKKETNAGYTLTLIESLDPERPVAVR